METETNINGQHHSGYVALIGKPNVGKSTLLNALVGRKLSIVTRKPQTTRQRILGILSGESYQIIFLDTPGIVRPRYRLHESMMHDVRDAIADADILLFMADATQSSPDEFSLEFVQEKNAILIINKMDLIRREDALPLVESYIKLRAFDEVIPISATTGYNLDLLLQELVKRLPLGPPFYPKEMVSEQPERFFVAEIIREKIFDLYREEVPYSTHVNIVIFEEREGEKDL
ncbi:MAG: GTPase Era, partial [Rhodothermales bacterium]